LLENKEMRLYYMPGACSLSPHIVLREAGLPFELDRIDFATRKTERGIDFASINPKGMVPTLQLDDGEVLTEGAVIVQYVGDQKPGSGLVPPAGSMARYRVQEWLNYIASELHKTFSPLFNPKTPEDYRQMLKERLSKQFEQLDRHLAKNQFLAGGNFTAPDAYCFTVLRWAASPRVGLDIARWPTLKAYFDRIAARPKVREAMQAEGLQA
jgi:glutathione S-transferase